jgi:hypothetical protein
MRPSLSAARSTHRLLREEVPVERRWDAPLRELLLEKGEVAVVCAERRRGSIGMRQQPSSRLMRVAPGTDAGELGPIVGVEQRDVGPDLALGLGQLGLAGDRVERDERRLLGIKDTLEQGG